MRLPLASPPPARRRPLSLGLAAALSMTLLAACSDDSAESLDELGDDFGDEYGDEYGGDELGDEGFGEDGAGDSGGAEGGENEDGGEPIEPGQLTGGEWRDLDDWGFWLALGEQASAWTTQFHHWGVDTSMRIPVLALVDGEPAADVVVQVRDGLDDLRWTARTNNEGEAELWPAFDGELLQPPLTILANGHSVVLDTLPEVGSSNPDPVVFELDEDPGATGLDLMFVVDTTGSMGDELSYLQVELEDVINRVSSDLANDVNLRLSVNFYRDEGDDYVVEPFPFTDDPSVALTQLAAQSTDGGGDWPEAVDAALVNAVYDHQWRDSARARLMFLILDAPPHDTPQIRDVLNSATEDAAALGVRIIPVAASGIDKPTEFLLRSLDIATGGTYTFLTDHSGIGGSHLEPTVGEYSVELFNDMLVRLIVEAMQ